MFHQTIIIGNVGGNPETKALPNGRSVTNFSVAVNERWKDKEGEKQERTEWYRCAAFGRTAEIVAEYVKKGNLITVVGRQQTDTVEGEDGTKYFIKLIVDSVKLMPKVERSEQSESRGSSSGKKSGGKQREEPAGDENFDDDIPF